MSASMIKPSNLICNDKTLNACVLNFHWRYCSLLIPLSLIVLEITLIPIEYEGWRRHSKPNIEVSGWLFQTKTHFTHIVYQPFSRVSPPSFTLYAYTWCWVEISNFWDWSKFWCLDRADLQRGSILKIKIAVNLMLTLG